MKPATKENQNHFFHVLMGECDHKWIINLEAKGEHQHICSKCKEVKPYYFPYYPDYTTNPVPVLNWMRENMPKVLDSYLKSMRVNSIICIGVLPDLYVFTRMLRLENIYLYLTTHTAWAEKECEQYSHNDYDSICTFIECSRRNSKCAVTGRIVHPALAWARNNHSVRGEG